MVAKISVVSDRAGKKRSLAADPQVLTIPHRLPDFLPVWNRSVVWCVT